MAQEAKEIEQELEDTRKAIRETWNQMEDRADQAVERVKEGIKSSVDVKAKIQRHPLEALATAATLGLVTGALVFRKSPNRETPRGPTLFDKAQEMFHDEINIVKGAIAATAVNQLATAVSRVAPQWQTVVSSLATSASEKFVKEKVSANARENAAPFGEEGVETEFAPPAGLERKDLH